MFRSMLLTGLLLCSLPLCLAAADKEEKKDEVIHTKISEAKPCCAVASTVNFRKELGLPLDYLSGIGNRIAVARKSPDPVELALAAQSLQVAEKLAGKKASVTSADVLREALDLAKMRAISNELAAVALIVSDENVKKDLDKRAGEAKQAEKDKAAAVKDGEQDKELFGTLTVDNHTHECLNIHVGGRFYGTVHAGQRGRFHVHDHGNPTVLEAFCEEEGELVRSSVNYGHFHSLYWHID